jgi:putative endonuclease
MGEIDLVLRRRDVIVFCEVKTRRGSRLGGGFEAVDARKRRKLRSLAEVFLLTHAAGTAIVRFDVASVSVRPGHGAVGVIDVELFEDAF